MVPALERSITRAVTVPATVAVTALTLDASRLLRELLRRLQEDAEAGRVNAAFYIQPQTAGDLADVESVVRDLASGSAATTALLDDIREEFASIDGLNVTITGVSVSLPARTQVSIVVEDTGEGGGGADATVGIAVAVVVVVFVIFAIVGFVKRKQIMAKLRYRDMEAKPGSSAVVEMGDN